MSISANITLQLKDVSAGYASVKQSKFPWQPAAPPDNYTIEQLSFDIQTGERIAIVGPNGAGKSTLFKLIAGTLQPAEGEIRVHGDPAKEHQCIAYVPQRSQVDWSFPVTVKEVVMMGRTNRIGLFRRPQKEDWAMVQQSLERVNGLEIADKQIGELSGGQQQRVFIARALAQETHLLLLDEPLTGLDMPSRNDLFEILDSLRPDGVTVMVATHDLNLAAERFDRMLLLNKKMIAFGKPAEVLRPENLLQAYGGHLHIARDNEQTILLADTCCDHEGK